MKTSLATVASVIGVLVTSASAFAVNTAVLQSPPALSAAAAQADTPAPFSAPLPPAVSGSVSATGTMTVLPPAPGQPLNAQPANPQGTPSSDLDPSSPLAPPDAPALPAPASAPIPVPGAGASAGRVSVFDLGALGTVTLSTTATGVEVVSISSSWKATTERTAHGVTIKFANGSQLVSFQAANTAGKLTTSVQNQTVVTVAPRAPERHDDEDDEDDDDDEDEEQHDSNEWDDD